MRDVHADGDLALIKVDGGLNINGVPGIDNVTPDSVAYGFENFVTTRSPEGSLGCAAEERGEQIRSSAATSTTRSLHAGFRWPEGFMSNKSDDRRHMCRRSPYSAV